MMQKIESFVVTRLEDDTLIVDRFPAYIAMNFSNGSARYRIIGGDGEALEAEKLI